MAQVNGQVEAAAGSRNPGILVIEPEALSRLGSMGFDHLDLSEDLYFQSHKLPPGSYYLYAFEEADLSRATDPTYLKLFRKHAAKVTLAEEDMQTITLKQISAAQAEDALKGQ